MAREHSLRVELAEARAILRDAQDNHRRAVLTAEIEAITRGTVGSNETERKRTLAWAVDEDATCSKTQEVLRLCEKTVDVLQARVDDERYALRERVVTAYEGIAASDEMPVFRLPPIIGTAS